MKRIYSITSLAGGFAALTLMCSGCSSGPRVYGNSVYDNNIYNFYMNGRNQAARNAKQAIPGLPDGFKMTELCEDGQSSTVEFSRVSYILEP